ncbi:MAG: hypothetical protein JXR41_01250, partial [Bacteroidales bacterium]|nr:hypothetical protein [Bacteroidales bacterium]
MIKISKDQIKEIAEDIDFGMKCYINKETGAVTTSPDSNSWKYYDEELWEDVNNELEENWDKYVEIPKMESNESFDLMADFTEIVDNKNLGDKLINALNRSHPFRNFNR